MKDCPVPSCRSRIARWWLVQPLCRLHWARVPDLLKREIQRTAAQVEAARQNPTKLGDGAAEREYRLAVESAVDAQVPDLSYLERRAS